MTILSDLKNSLTWREADLVDCETRVKETHKHLANHQLELLNKQKDIAEVKEAIKILEDHAREKANDAQANSDTT